MYYNEIVPYEDLVEATQDKFAYLYPNQQAICTPEFQQLSAQVYGGPIFGENTVVTVAKLGLDISFLFKDRVVSAARDNPFLSVATLTDQGLCVNNETVVLDWASKRVVNEDGSVSFDGLRETAIRTPLPTDDVPAEVLSAVVREVAAWRRRIYMTPETPFPSARPATPDISAGQAQNAQFAERLRSLDKELTEDAITDIAEVLTTERNPVPHSLITPGAKDILDEIVTADTRQLNCDREGLFIGRGSTLGNAVLEEIFLAGAADRHQYLDAAEEVFDGRSGYCTAVGIGRVLTYAEKTAINTYARRAYLTPTSSLPPGVIYTNELYRVHAPHEARLLESK